MLAALLFPLFFAATPGTVLPLLPADAFHNTYLVRGIVAGGRETDGYTTNQVRIEHAYHGPKSLLGKTFEAYSADTLPDGFAYPYITIPSLRVGETLIAFVSERRGQMSTGELYDHTRWPVRERGNPDWMPSYETIKAFAEAVERVSQLPGSEEATSALKRLAADANPYISSWAIARLPVVSQRSAAVSKFLMELVADNGVPVQGQVELDRVLLGQEDGSISVEHRDPKWQLSEARVKLFRRWFAGAQSKRDAELVVSRLDGITQHPDTQGFHQEDLLRLVTLLAANDKFPLPERQHASIIMSWAAQRYEGGDEKLFDTAVELVSSELPEQLRARIAGVFVSGVALDEPRRGVLTRLRDAEKTESVTVILDKALARPNGEPERRFRVRHKSK